MPNWKVIVEDRANVPEMATELMLKSVLPKDAKYVKSLTFKNLSDRVSTSVATVMIRFLTYFVYCYLYIVH